MNKKLRTIVRKVSNGTITVDKACNAIEALILKEKIDAIGFACNTWNLMTHRTVRTINFDKDT